MCLRDVVDQFHHVYGFTYTRTTEQTNFTTLRKRTDQVDNLDTCLQQLSGVRLIFVARCSTVNNPRFIVTDRTLFIHWLRITSYNVCYTKLLRRTLEEKWQETQQQRPNEWMLAEASYLLRMAGRKLWLEQDLATSIALLTDADGRLQAMADPSLIPLRKALAEDIASLKSAPNIDIEGLSLRVGILIDNLDQLKIKGSDPKRTAAPQSDEISEQISDWKDNLEKSAKNFAENFVTIRRRTSDVEALLSPEQSAYLLENLRLQLQLAQLNLQHQDQANFRDHLKKAQTWLQNYYEADDSTTQFMLKEIDALQQVEITAHYPVEFKSQPILEKVITERSQTPAR